MSELSRRQFVTRSVAAAAAAQIGAQLASSAKAQATAPAPAHSAPVDGVELRWLEGSAPAHFTGTTVGVPWPRGARKADDAVHLKDANGEPVLSQEWPLAYWPDGSLKWTAHAISSPISDKFVLAKGPSPIAAKMRPIAVESADAIAIDTGAIRCQIKKTGPNLIESIERDGKPTLRGAQLVALKQDQADDLQSSKLEDFASNIEKVAVDPSSSAIRAVVKIEGKHKSANRSWLPFTVRLYFYQGSDAVRVVHTFIFDGDEQKDFIRGIGLRFDVPMRDELHNRHVRLVGESSGLFGEAVRNLTGLRRDPGADVKAAQVAGLATPDESTFPSNVRDRLQYIPAWGDFTLSQLSADGFMLKKRTKAGHGWIAAGAGHRASGVGYVGGPTGGVAFGLRDFWQKHPAQLDIRSAATDTAQVTMWLWSPEAPPMDLRFYHDGMGMENHQQELQGLEITYEDYEKGFGTPVGIARTSEMMLWATAATPERKKLVEFAEAVQKPPMLVCKPQYYADAGVFGGLFKPVDRSTPARTRIEDTLDFYLDYYLKQIEQRRWYGFWDYGDVMHTYDPDRHCWRYDVGGYAWDNSELSPDLWLWYSFLRSGRADIFRMAEAMTRHTGEVDTYHLGRFAMLGTRHNVQHWGCSAKQQRISTAIYRRFYYYLTADERVGDLMRELVEADQTFLTLDPIRKIRQGAYTPDRKALSVGFGTDWGSLASAWLTEVERNPDAPCKQKLINGMKSIGSMPKGFFQGDCRYDLDTGTFTMGPSDAMGLSHLSAVFGLVEVCAELISSFEIPEFEKAWLQYCELYSAPPEQQQAALGQSFRNNSLRDAHSRLTAYAAVRKKDPKLVVRAWQELLGREGDGGARRARNVRKIEGPDVLNPVDESAWISTNATAQWSLGAIQCLALVGDQLPAENR